MFLNSLLTLTLLTLASSRSLLPRQSCTCTGSGQSCEIADISGSTGCPYTTGVTLEGGTEAGVECIAQYNPNFVPGSITITPTGLKSRSLQPSPKQKRQLYTYNDLLDGTCGSYLLIFARGTTEEGNFGETVGPALQEGLSLGQIGKWAFQGVNYNATTDGDDCLGLPGGAVATQYIEQAATQCPGTKIIVSGYSEGAMVAHNGVGYASASAQAAVTVSPSSEANKRMIGAKC